MPALAVGHLANRLARVLSSDFVVVTPRMQADTARGAAGTSITLTLGLRALTLSCEFVVVTPRVQADNAQGVVASASAYHTCACALVHFVCV